ncbi:MAG TPA: response regulator [Acidobacteriaceae bacterium]|nr:response regulator [Acidobacteriaceae bacterium]
MTEDSTPQPESSSPSPQGNPSAAGQNAPRQKQSFRRRRKRRGSGGNPGQGANQGQAAANGQANGAAAPAPQGNAPRNENQPRKKKRFFKKNQRQGQGQNQANAGGPRGDSRGNSTGQQQQRRGGKQRRPKVFVGPMDHSYRAVNGNYSDAPPSTIELQRGFTNAHYNGNGNGNFNADYSGAGNGGRSFDDLQGSASATGAADDAAATPVRIYCFIDDLFFIAKIQETARKLGIRVAFVKNDKDTIADLLALPEEERPTLIVFDLNSATAKPLTLIPKLKAKLKRATSIVGFLSHLQGELKAKAIEAGCDTVMPRSAFSQTLPNLLRRYGIEVEIEDDQAQVIEA